MYSTSNELILLLVGIAAALSSFHPYFAIDVDKRKRWPLLALLAVGVITNVTTQVLQYKNAVIAVQDLDRRTSEALYALNTGDEKLLLKVADPRIDERNPFLLGYWYFKRGYTEYMNRGPTPSALKNLASARQYLAVSIRHGRFVPQSYYILGTIVHTIGSDWTEARKDFDLSIQQDERYAAPWYGRAILREQNKDLGGALDDLQRAATLSVITCWDVRDPEEQAEVWPQLKDTDRYREISAQCGAEFELQQPVNAPSSAPQQR
jgi:hypothetical protein